MCKWLSDRMVKKGIIEETDQELYTFGIQNGFVIVLNLFTAFMIGVLTDELLIVAVFTVSFMTLRSFTGGYHSESKLFCYICSNLLLIVPIYTGGDFVNMQIAAVIGILVVASVVILFLSPMDCRRRTLDQAEKKYFGKRARGNLILQILVFSVLYGMNQMQSAYAVYSSIVSIAVFMLIGSALLKIQQLNIEI